MTNPIEARLNELRILAGKYANAQANREYLDNFRHSKLAILMKTFDPNFPTAAAQEREARAHPEYLLLLEGLRAATEEAERCRWELKIAEMGAGLWQTKCANERAERKGYGA